MGKADPRTAKGGERKATGAAPSDEPHPKNNRLATLIAEAIFQDQEVLQEIQALLSASAKATKKSDGTSTTAPVSETGILNEETETDDVALIRSLPNFGDSPSTSTASDNSLGLFSTVHPPLD
ncbi:hypothetical protein DPMN_156058 [Dreissena polymorpha]|uniref:Uncharacterized protein n=1 Tax=Dreissena polymorpha TaxID=45954 RepID=A0A9D4FUW6_DREPO|nr:hypothetical protein DPMN_156058 [Dreissena polymorpha]